MSYVDTYIVSSVIGQCPQCCCGPLMGATSISLVISGVQLCPCSPYGSRAISTTQTASVTGGTLTNVSLGVPFAIPVFSATATDAVTLTLHNGIVCGDPMVVYGPAPDYTVTPRPPETYDIQYSLSCNNGFVSIVVSYSGIFNGAGDQANSTRYLFTGYGSLKEAMTTGLRNYNDDAGIDSTTCGTGFEVGYGGTATISF